MSVIEAARYMHLQEDAKAVAKYLRALAEPGISEAEKKELRFRAALRLLRLEREVELVGKALEDV